MMANISRKERKKKKNRNQEAKKSIGKKRENKIGMRRGGIQTRCLFGGKGGQEWQGNREGR